MTADELAAELYARQGYLVVAASAPLQIGARLSNTAVTNLGQRLSTPIVVTGPSNRPEFMKQSEISKALRGARDTIPTYPHFYRVEAMD